MPEHRIRLGQVYESCQPVFVVDGNETRTRIKVIGELVGVSGFYGSGKVQVATVIAGGREIRPRVIEVSQLHASGTTRDGSPRRTGYRLVEEAPDA